MCCRNPNKDKKCIEWEQGLMAVNFHYDLNSKQSCGHFSTLLAEHSNPLFLLM